MNLYSRSSDDYGTSLSQQADPEKVVGGGVKMVEERRFDILLACMRCPPLEKVGRELTQHPTRMAVCHSGLQIPIRPKRRRNRPTVQQRGGSL
jgi:hypothetical protein